MLRRFRENGFSVIAKNTRYNSSQLQVKTAFLLGNGLPLKTLNTSISNIFGVDSEK